MKDRSVGRAVAKKLRILREAARFYGVSASLRFALRSAAYSLLRTFTRRRSVTRRIGPYRMALDLRTGGISKVLYVYGEREADVGDLLKRSLRPGDSVLDLGANIGYFVLKEAGLVGGRGRICAVEPDPRNLTLLRRNLSLNGLEDRVQVGAYALTGGENEAGRVRFALHAKTNLNHVLGRNESPRRDGVLEIVDVEATDIRTLLEEIGGTDLLRMDIEGYEVPILAAIAELAESRPELTPRRILFEAHPADYGPAGADLAKPLDSLFLQGYRVEALTTFEDDTPSPMATAGLEPARLARSEYHVWGIYQPVEAGALLRAVGDLGCARHVLLVRDG